MAADAADAESKNQATTATKPTDGFLKSSYIQQDRER